MKLHMAYKNRSLEILTILFLFECMFACIERIIISEMTPPFYFHKVKLVLLIVWLYIDQSIMS